MEKNYLDGPEMFYGATPIIFERARELRRNQTVAERLLWSCLSKKQLGVKFRRQHPVNQFIVDFYCHELKLVIEVDGGIHLSKESKEKDISRDAIMNELGIEIVRVTNDEIYDTLSQVADKLKSVIKRIKAPS